MSMKYLNILKKIEIEEKRRDDAKLKRYKSSTFSKLKKYFWRISVVLALSSIICSLIFYNCELVKDSLIKYLPFLFLILSYFFMIGFMFIDVIRSKSKFKRHLLLPFCSSINSNVKSSYLIDRKYIDDLLKLDLQVLELGNIEIKNERIFLEKRIGLMIGALDKLGILPGLLSTLAVLPNFGFNWISSIAYAYIGLVAISFKFYPIMMRYERMIELTELAIKIKNKQSN